MTESNSRIENQILHFSKLQKWNKVEEFWTELAEEPVNSPRFYAIVGKRLVKAEKTSELKSWTMLLVESCVTLELDRTLIQVCRGLLTACTEFEELREPLLTVINKQYAKHPRLEEFVEESGLKHEAGLSKPLSKFLQYIKYSEGEVFQHGDWGEGKVLELDVKEERVRLEFLTQGEKTFSFAGVREFLKRIPRSNFFAQRVLDPESLATRADKEPVEFLKFVLKSMDGVATRADLKNALSLKVFPDRKWNLWWTKNRDAFRFEPYVSFTGTGANVTLSLRDKPKSFYEELLAEFKTATSFSKRYSVIGDILKFSSREPLPENVGSEILQELNTLQNNCLSKDQIMNRIEYLFTIEDLVRTVPALKSPDSLADTKQLIAEQSDPIALITSFAEPDHQIRVMEQLFATHEREPMIENCELLFPDASLRLGQWMVQKMIDEKMQDATSHMVEQQLLRPSTNLDISLWLARCVRENKLEALHVETTPGMIFAAIMDAIDDCNHRMIREEERRIELKGLITKMQGLLGDQKHKLVIEAFAEFSVSRARDYYAAMVKNESFSNTFKVSLRHSLASVREDLGSTAEETQEAEEHLVTAESFEIKQREFHQIKNEDIPANSKAIGEAAAQGDLSENAEYDAAKSEQKILFRRLESLEDLLRRAKVLDPAMIRTEVISCGTTFRVNNLEAGQEEQYTLLGQWDAIPENNILSYQTPFAQQFLNHKVDETLDIKDNEGNVKRYKVLEITNALTTPTEA